MTGEARDTERPTALTDFQVVVSRTFFSLPASDRFLLAGGAALVAQHMSSRPTQDLTFFTGVPGAVAAARQQFEAAAGERGWSVEVRQATDTFCRFVVRGADDVLVDIALDSPPLEPATASFVGPTFAPRELAARKLLALFDRAAARDFVDVFVLAKTFPRGLLVAGASGLDPGFETGVLADQFEMLERFRDADLPIDAERIAELRSYFRDWAAALRNGPSDTDQSVGADDGAPQAPSAGTSE